MDEITENTEKKRKKRQSKNELVRVITKITDGELANKCRVWAQLLNENLPAFQALDASFDAAYVADWYSAVEAFEVMPTNEYMEDLQIESRVVLEQKRAAFGVLLKDLEYYVQRAFPNRKRIDMEFGLHKLRTPQAARGIRDVVIGYATLLRIEYYKAPLLAGGMPPAFPLQLDAALGEYGEAEIKHQYSLLETIRATTDRIYAFNSLYATHQRVLAAAEAVFDGDKIKIDLFRL